jgi:hypothetical protein
MASEVLLPALAELGYDPTAVPHRTVYPDAFSLGSHARVTLSAHAAAGAHNRMNATASHRPRHLIDILKILRDVFRVGRNPCAVPKMVETNGFVRISGLLATIA